MRLIKYSTCVLAMLLSLSSAHAADGAAPAPPTETQQIQKQLFQVMTALADQAETMVTEAAALNVLALQVQALRIRCTREPRKPDWENR